MDKYQIAEKLIQSYIDGKTSLKKVNKHLQDNKIEIYLKDIVYDFGQDVTLTDDITIVGNNKIWTHIP